MGWYVTFNKFETSKAAEQACQLPTSNPKYRVHINTSEITDDLRSPYGEDEFRLYFEPVCRDYPYPPG
jgi:hypothetical protein